MPNQPPPTRAARVAQSSLIFSLALLTLAGAVRAQQSGVAVTAVPQTTSAAREVRLTITVTNEKGYYIGGVERENVEVFEGKTRREVTSFGPADEHASVGVLFDISRSMREGHSRIESARQAVARFTRQASPRNEYFLWAFNKRLMELTPEWARDEAALGRALDKIAPEAVTKDGDGATALYDACAAALGKLSGGPLPRRVLLLFTDGSDNYSRQMRLKDLKRMVWDSNVLLYAVAVLDKYNPATLDMEGQATLDDLVTLSGGRAFFTENSRELNSAVDQIAMELKHQYVIGFAPRDAAKSGELNKVKVRIKPPPDYKSSVLIRSREGYLTP